MVNSKKKGNKGENDFANWLRNQGIDNASRNSSSGANDVKSDVINSLGINFEVKTVKSLNIHKAFEQSVNDSIMSSTIPYVVVHYDGMPKDTWYMIMYNHDWTDLIKAKLAMEGKLGDMIEGIDNGKSFDKEKHLRDLKRVKDDISKMITNFKNKIQ